MSRQEDGTIPKMQAHFLYVKGRKYKSEEAGMYNYASFSVRFTPDSVFTPNFGKPRQDFTAGSLNSPKLTKTSMSEGDVKSFVFDNIDSDPPVLDSYLKLRIRRAGKHCAQTPRESSLLMRMKPYFPALLDTISKNCPYGGNQYPLVEFVFEDEIRDEPDRILFACSSSATHAQAICLTKSGDRIAIEFNKRHANSVYNSKRMTWEICDLTNIIVPQFIQAEVDETALESAFMNLAQNMFENCPVPSEAKIWNFKSVIKTVIVPV